MARHPDSRDVTFTAASRSTVERFEQACTLFHGYYADPVTAIDAVLADEPDFAMGLAFKAGMFCTATERAAYPVIDELLARLQPLRASATDRERLHIDAIAAWRAGRFDLAAERWGRASLDQPRDLLALQFAHLADFFLGQTLSLRDRPARALHAWSGVPGQGYVQSMLAFGMEECGHYDEAERLGKEALEGNRRDPWGVHAVTHVYEMQNRIDEGIDWLQDRVNDWAPGNLFAFHNWWHLALFHLDRNDVDAALRLYDTRIRPRPSQVALELLDASALLWRLRLREVDVGARWSELAESWAALASDGIYAFNDVHAAMAFLGADRAAELDTLLGSMRAAAQGADCNAAMTREVGLPVVEAMVDFTRQRYQAAVDRLLPVLPIAQRYGGSHAQRDLLALTTLEAALRGGDRPAARALASQRLVMKPRSRHNQDLARRAEVG